MLKTKPNVKNQYPVQEMPRKNETPETQNINSNWRTSIEGTKRDFMHLIN